MKIYNTLSRKKEDFVPITPGEVKIYACGVTVYDECHLGHAMQAVFFDIVRRYFEYLGNRVVYVRNYTDIDDKIIAKAAETGKDALAVSAHYIGEAEKDMKALKVRPATFEPKVSDNIDAIIGFIRGLIEKGFAYEAGGEVFFEVSRFAGYGKLSGRRPEELVPDPAANALKRAPQDFSLWKPAKPGEPSWDSPWGRGRPGWHIECSTLAKKYLGETIDIHGGGVDIIFPHHENEIAQSEALHARRFANYWVHNGLVMVDNRKMSKSLKNFYTIKTALEKYPADVIRFMILSFGMASNVNFTEENLSAAHKRVYYYYQVLERIDAIIRENGGTPVAPNGQHDGFSALFREAMDDFFNTARLLGTFPARFKEIADLLASRKTGTEAKLQAALSFRESFGAISAVLGILDENPVEYLRGVRMRYVAERGIGENFVLGKIGERAKARAAGDFKTADAIRAELSSLGISLQDNNAGTDWSVIL